MNCTTLGPIAITSRVTILVSPWLLKRSPLLWLYNPLKGAQMCYSMIETSSVLPRKSSVIVGILRRFSGKCQETIVLPSGQLFEYLRKSSESVWKSSENRQKSRHQYVYIINKIIHGGVRVDMEFLFSCSTLFLMSELSSLVRYQVERKEKFYIYANPCIILYIFRSKSNLSVFQFYSVLELNQCLVLRKTQNQLNLCLREPDLPPKRYQPLKVSNETVQL